MSSKLSVCFGASLIITGIFNFIFETNNIILLGMNLSALIFSLINFCILIFYKYIKSDKIEFIYILPFVILLLFCCFSESLESISFIKNLSSSKILNAITFLSFGLIFISEYFNYRKELDISRNLYYQKLSNDLVYNGLILTKILDYKSKIKDESGIEFLNSMESLFDEQIKKIKLESSLLKSGQHYFSIVDVDKAYVENNEILNFKSK